MLPYFRFRIQRQVRRLRRDLRAWRHWFSVYFDRHVWGKWQQLGIIRRFVAGWWLLLLVMFIGVFSLVGDLGHYITSDKPVAGGSYIEGIVGEVKSLNPLFPAGVATSDVNRLVFSGLTRITPKREIEGDLATGWTVSSDGKTYTFALRKDVKWHDGTQFTAQDVLYTLAMIQNPDTRSPLTGSWQGVRVEAKDDYTVIFNLPNPYSPFIYSTTLGILPSHLLGGVDASSLRVHEFNQKPVGTGPFRVTRFVPADREILLAANSKFYFGRPLLDQFTVELYDTDQELRDAYSKHQLTAIGGLSGGTDKLGSAKSYSMNLPHEVTLFWHMTTGPLQDKAVRQALAHAINRTDIVDTATDRQAVSLGLPILPGQLGYTTKNRPPAYDLAAAGKLLDGAGWKRPNAGQLRTKDGKQLVLKLVTARTGDYPKVAVAVQEQLAKVGVKVEITATDTTTLQQSYIRPRNYDVLLYGINIGPDPDVYSFWHSSQVDDPGLNLSQYKSPAADKALESARLTNDNNVRSIRYGNFLAAWASDVPGVVLYSPVYVYATSPTVNGIKAKMLVDPADRFYGVEDWTVKTKTVPR